MVFVASVPKLSVFAVVVTLVCSVGCSDRHHTGSEHVPESDSGEPDGSGDDLDGGGTIDTMDAASSDAATAGLDADTDGTSTSGDPATTIIGASRDRFGVLKIYPTKLGGREWYLPDDADRMSQEWNVEANPVTRVGAGVFRTAGNNGETRLTVGSPLNKTWWRNVEMTGYFRYMRPHDSYDQERHWEFLARSGVHTSNDVRPGDINGGIGAPPGTPAWPGYPFGAGAVNGHCLGTSYHGNLYVAGYALFEKEVSHIAGYSGPRGRIDGVLKNPEGRWFGFKFVLRNADFGRRVHMEIWLDAQANGGWKRISTYDDVAGRWPAAQAAVDGCTKAPFSYRPDQLITWAGPWLTFRSDSIEVEFKSFSAREIWSL